MHTQDTILMLMESQLPGLLLSLSLKGVSLLLSWGWGSNGATLRLMMEFSRRKGGGVPGRGPEGEISTGSFRGPLLCSKIANHAV